MRLDEQRVFLFLFLFCYNLLSQTVGLGNAAFGPQLQQVRLGTNVVFLPGVHKNQVSHTWLQRDGLVLGLRLLDRHHPTFAQLRNIFGVLLRQVCLEPAQARKHEHFF
jgi:hypothetical protein